MIQVIGVIVVIQTIGKQISVVNFILLIWLGLFNVVQNLLLEKHFIIAAIDVMVQNSNNFAEKRR